jgi:hypothetical protein
MAMSLPDRSLEQESDVPLRGSPEHVAMVERTLLAEFAQVLSSDVLRRVASEAVGRFDEVPVQAFVPILAVRTARRHARSIADGEVG